MGEEDKEAEKEKKKREAEKEEDEAAAGTIAKEKNWSAVNLTFKESKLSFRGVLSPLAFTNWVWYRCVRPKLEETKAKLPDIDTSDGKFGIEDVEELFGEFMPKEIKKPGEGSKDKDEKDKKKDKKDDKKDKKDDKKDKKDDRKEKKSKKDAVTLNAKE